MKYFIHLIIFIGCLHSAAGQSNEVLDSMDVAITAEEMLEKIQEPDLSMIETLSAPAQDNLYEYIPADATPELIADRLSCIQQSIPLTYNERIHAFINYFTVRDREYTKMVIRRTNVYFPLIEKYLAKYNLPDELKYLAIIESGLNPKAISRAQAGGLWQFMPATGRYFDLHSNWYYDDRLDPEKATEAACKYLSQLYTIFNDWELALAAYNSGPGTVRSAIRRSGYKRNFWEVYRYLPRETRAYVPQFVAMIYTINYSAEHNFYDLGKEESIPSDTIMVRQFLNFETFASLTETCVEDLNKLNPAVRHSAIPENSTGYALRIPIHSKEMLEQNRLSILDSASKGNRIELEQIAKASAANTYGRELVKYTVKSGDAISLVAERFRVRMSDIRGWNNMSGNTIRIGQQLNIWVLPGSLSTSPLPPASPPAQVSEGQQYIVQPGDTLWDISRKFEGLSIEKLKTLNNLKSNTLKPGQRLILG